MKTNIILFNIPSNLRYFWNIGSILGFITIIQIIRGIFLSFFFIANEKLRFFIVRYFIENDVFLGYLFRLIHLNFARAFFIRIFLHLFRNLFYKRFNKGIVWCTGISLLLILIITAFIGYVLPWGQISFWGARVITRFLTVVPFLGKKIVIELWRGFAVGQRILSFFFRLHFILPFILLIVILFHLIYLHLNLSRNKVFSIKRTNKKPFNNLLLNQDLINIIYILLFLNLIILIPFIFDDEENSKIANEIRSPIHIKPEWYFLFAYAILRSIPNKLGGVIAIALRIIYFYLFIFKKNKKIRNKYNLILSIFIFSCILLTWIGGNAVEDPYILIGQILLFSYFMLIVY